MTSDVDIANIALANIHAASINSFDEKVLNAQYSKLFYPKALNSLLQYHNWSFANAEKPLALLTTELFSWVYCYQYPTDCERINYLKSPVSQISALEPGFAIRPWYNGYNSYNDIVNLQLNIAHEIKIIDDNRVIGANEPDLWVDYHVVTNNPNNFSSLFIDAFAWRLSAELAIPIVGGDVGRAYAQNASITARQLLNEAIAADLNEKNNLVNGGVKESEFILVR